MKFEYCYVVTSENLDGSDVRLSGECYHDANDAIEFIKNRSDHPKKENPFIWRGKYVYKVHVLTFKSLG